MKFSRFFVFVLLLPAVVSAQNKIDMAGMQLLDDFRAQQYGKASRAAGDMMPVRVDTRLGVEIPSDVMATVRLRQGVDASVLEQAGLEVMSQRGCVAIVRMPLALAGDIAGMDDVIAVSMGGEARPLLNQARTASQVTAVQAGTDLPQAYDGSGVVTGLMDTGLDPNHINFSGRVSRVWVLKPSTATSVSVQAYDTPSKIAAFTTEDASATHGTHVLGIMAGDYNGEGKYAAFSTSGNVLVNTKAGNKIPYYGVAKGADIAICCGTLADPCILRAGDLVVDYAQSVGKPAVFNLSLGNNIGPHDGTDATSLYLAELGREAIICLSAGNEGASDISFEKSFTASDDEFRTFVTYDGTNLTSYKGSVDLWGGDGSLFNTTFVVFDTQSQQIVYSYCVDRNTAGADITIADSRYTAAGYIHDSAFDAAFLGYVIFRSNVDPSNGRYNIDAYISLSPAAGTSGRYVPGFIVNGNPGVSVNGFCSSGLLFSGRGYDGWSDGTPDNSANGMACGDNLLVIGAYNSRNRVPRLNGSVGTISGYTVGDVSNFSSYGVQPNGRSIPDFCAPGCALVSSISSYYVDALNVSSGYLVAQQPLSSASRMNYWSEMSGTSMASPYAAGVVALMLQAVPVLTVDEVREILAGTCIRDESVVSSANQVKWGAGKIDALAAMKELLSRYAAVGTVFADDTQRLVVTPAGGAYDVFVAGESGIEVRLYDMQGRQAAAASGSGCSATVDVVGLAKGVYLMVVQGSTGRYTRKIAV